MSFRVPTSDVSVVDLTVELVKEATYDEICKAMKAAVRRHDEGHPRLHRRQGRLDDFVGEACTSVFDAEAGIALDKTFVKVVSWYDNEWGYSTRCWRWRASSRADRRTCGKLNNWPPRGPFFVFLSTARGA